MLIAIYFLYVVSFGLALWLPNGMVAIGLLAVAPIAIAVAWVLIAQRGEFRKHLGLLSLGTLLFLAAVSISFLTLNMLAFPAMAVGVLGLGMVLHAYLLNSNPFPWWRTSIAGAGALLLCFALIPFISTTAPVTAEMTWTCQKTELMGYPACDDGKCQKAEFRFVKNPNRYETIISTDLCEKLIAQRKERVTVHFEAHRVYGQTQSHHETRIEGIDGWNYVSGSAGCQGECGEFPF